MLKMQLNHFVRFGEQVSKIMSYQSIKLRIILKGKYYIIILVSFKKQMNHKFDYEYVYLFIEYNIIYNIYLVEFFTIWHFSLIIIVDPKNQNNKLYWVNFLLNLIMVNFKVLGHYFKLVLIGYFVTPQDIKNFNFIKHQESNFNTFIMVVNSHVFVVVVNTIVEQVIYMDQLVNCMQDFIKHMDLLVNYIKGGFIKHMDQLISYFIDMVIEFQLSMVTINTHYCN